jgi:hypothetical protein
MPASGSIHVTTILFILTPQILPNLVYIDLFSNGSLTVSNGSLTGVSLSKYGSGFPTQRCAMSQLIVIKLCAG